MTRFMKKISKKIGLMPGTVVFVGEKKVEEVRIHVIDYNEKEIQEREVKTAEECFPFKDSPTITWVRERPISCIWKMTIIGAHSVESPIRNCWM